MAYAKINSITNANMAKVSSAAKAALGKIGSIDAPGDAFADDYSLLFDASNDYVNLADAASAISGVTGTISFWAKPTAGYFFELKVDANNYIQSYFYASGDTWMTTIRRAGGSNSSASAFDADPSFNDDNWHFVTVTWSEAADKFIAYNDGAARQTVTSIGSWSGTPSIFTLGTYVHWSGGWYGGNINDFAVWSSALSAAGIYNSGTPTDLTTDSGDYASSDDLIGYWKMEENTGTSVADSSTNSNAATLVNGTAFEADTP